MNNIMNQLRQAILTSGKTRYAIAKASGLSESHLSLVASGQRTLSVEAIDTLTDTLELEIIIRPKRRRGSNKGR